MAAQARASRIGFQSGMIVNRPVLLMIIKKHPLIPIMWISLLAFMTYLFIDAINTATIGYAAMPIGFLFGKAYFSSTSSKLLYFIEDIFLSNSYLPIVYVCSTLEIDICGGDAQAFWWYLGWARL